MLSSAISSSQIANIVQYFYVVCSVIMNVFFYYFLVFGACVLKVVLSVIELRRCNTMWEMVSCSSHVGYMAAFGMRYSFFAMRCPERCTTRDQETQRFPIGTASAIMCRIDDGEFQ